MVLEKSGGVQFSIEHLLKTILKRGLSKDWMFILPLSYG